MADTSNRLNPLIVIAAASIVIFSAVGVGVMTGVIPSSLSKSAENAPADARPVAAGETGKNPPSRDSMQQPAPAPAARSTQPNRAAVLQPAKPMSCPDCGRIESISVIEEKGEGTGLGAVAGGVVGGILGNQVGRGTGRKIATVAGAAGGAYAGHQIEKHAKSTKRYEVIVRMESGAARSVSYDVEPSFQVGNKVKIVNGMLVSI